MAHRALARGVAVGTAAIAVSALTFLGAGTAGAATASVSWDDWYSHFTRTASNATPEPGETITITTKFERTNSTEEYLHNIKDRHPACLTYIPGSAKMNNTPVTPTVVDDGTIPGRDPLVSVDFGPTEWVVRNQPGFSPVFSVSYKVEPGCARGTTLHTGMNYNGSLGSGSYYDKGPDLTISYLEPIGAGGSSGAGLGSLSGDFGS